jgi:hypothetical protein
MNPHPYVRPHLTASQNNVTDAALLVDLWVDQFLTLHDTRATESPDGSYDFLALWARLLRTRPELLAATERLAELEPVRQVVPEQAADLLGRAVTLPNPEEWLREAAQFDEAFDSAIDHADLAVWAERLLTDLDDATLIAWAARHFARADDELASQLEACESWLEQHADLFLACGVYVQAVGQTLRPDLPEHDWELARTADKFVILLDEQEAAQGRLMAADGVVVTPDVLAELFRRPPPTPAAVVPASDPAQDWPPLPFTKVLAAATAPTDAVHHRDWVSPDGVHRATLAVGSEDVELVRVNFYRGLEPAGDLADRTALLAGVRAVIDAEGNADFDVPLLRQARQAGKQFTLQLDDAGSAWRVPREEQRP